MDLRRLAVPGAVFRLRVTPRARREALDVAEDGTLRLHVLAPPEDGRANRAALALLASALGVAPSRLTLVRGGASRDKLVRLDP